jgi:hypothetical protein
MGIFKLNSSFSPAGDQPRAIERLVEGLNASKKFQTLMGVSSIRPAGPGHIAQQDTGRPALRGIQGAFPGKRRRILCQLLRLLSAGGLHPAARYLHRERCLEKRRPRPAPPFHHYQLIDKKRLYYRCLRLLHFRPRLTGRL